VPNNARKLILVTGATGHQGGAVLKHLQKKNFPLRALTRDPDGQAARALVGKGTEVVRGDLGDQASLTRALDGVYGAYSVQPSNFEDPEAEVREGFNLADTAARTRVNHIVYSSVGSADQKTGIPHFETKFRIEEHIRGKGTPYTILRPVFFMENWLGMKEQLEKGSIALPLKPETRLQMIAVNDIGAVAALAFEHKGHWQGRAIELAGDELSMADTAALFGRVLGHDMQYQQVPWDQFEQRAGREMTMMFRWFEEVGYHANIAEVRAEYAELTTLERWAQAHLRPAQSNVLTAR
jgi:uncharacterized protein YbjT (DUF2867 family)